MTHPNPESIEVLQRFSRRSLKAVLFLVVILGGTALSLILSPKGAVAHPAAGAWLIPVGIVIAVAAVQSSLRGRRWKPESPEVRTILQDEFRKANMDRAFRIAFIVLLAAQWPLALLLGVTTRLPAIRLVMAMAAGSITVGLLTLITLFLYFDRE